MKVFHLFLVFVCLLSADAQRRSVKSELLSDEPQPKSARRGRARFTVSTESPQVEEHTVSRSRQPSRRRPEIHSEAPSPIRKPYAVEENIEDTPQEPFRKTAKNRVFTENRFEAKNAPPSNALFQPATTENLDDVIRSIGGDFADTTFSSLLSSSTTPASLEPAPSEFSSSELSKVENDITRIQPETTTPTTTSRATKRSNGRSRSNAAPQPAPTAASRLRTRSRATRKPEEQPAAPTAAATRTVQRTSRRRLEASSNVEARTRAPAVIAAAETVEVPSRSRTGRKIPASQVRRADETKVVEDAPQSRRSHPRKSVESATAASTSAASSLRSRTRSRSRDVPPVIDEQKLEVLPLFERESKTVRSARKYPPRRRSFNSAEEVEMSATENDVKIAPRPSKQSVIVETRTEASVRRRTKPTFKLTTTKTTTTTTHKPSTKPSTTKPSTTKPSTTKPSTTKPLTKKPLSTSKPIIKESVIAEVSEVTSKRTLIRSKLVRNKVEVPKFVARGAKKSEVNLASTNKKGKSGLSSSEEDIEDTDNYPEHFKALLQAKKQNIESRPTHRAVTQPPTITKTTQKVVTSSPSTTTQATSSEAIRQLEDSENELDPGTRRRPDKVTRPTRKSKFVRSSTTSATPTREHRFHVKDAEASSGSPVKPTRSFSPKPPRGLYSSRKSKESLTKNKSAATAQIAAPKKTSRYSSRYRSEAAARGAIRTSTNAPAYLPTIPTITPPTPTSVKSPSAYQDKDLGVEVISFDDPVNTVSSANLVSGEYLASSTENHPNAPLVSASQTKTTEKPVSIIERIINSITAISTTEVPDPTGLTTPTTDPQTKSSAILKLAPKKSTKLDKVQTTQKIPLVTVTSEKPTTIIERILTSLSAIQADNTTDTKNFKSKQVGTNFNTISSPSTTPLTRVTKSSLSAPISTSVNPLFVLDEISNEQTLQKRTIDKLLALLNTLMSTTPSSLPTPLVVVTPKSAGYLVGTSVATTQPTTTSTTAAPPTTTTSATTTTSTTTAPTTTTTESPTTSSQLFTSPNLKTTVNVESTTTRFTSTPTVTTLSTQTPAGITSTVTTLTSTEATPTTTDVSNEIGALPLSIELDGTSTQSTTDSPFSVRPTLPTTELAVDTETNFVFPSTIPALINFEVSPGSVSIFSANDLANLITPDDFPSTTVTIQAKTNLPENVITTQSSTESITTQTSTESTTAISNANVQSRAGAESSQATTVQAETATPAPRTTPEPSTSTQTPTSTSAGSTVAPSTSTQTPTSTSAGTTVAPSTSTQTPTSTPAGSTVAPSTSTQTPTSTPAGSTVAPSTSTQTPTSTPAGSTVAPVTSTMASNTSKNISSNVIDTTGTPIKSNQTDNSSTTNAPPTLSGRSGRLLSTNPNPVQNSIENSTRSEKDYFIFAVLNNNTVLRKRPSRFPNKDTPFLIVGVYPNNTLVRKFPNGTLVPMEPVIRVSGFDTRENPPPLPEITSNQVTPDQGSQPENKNLQTVDQNTISPFEANPLSLSTVNNATTTTGAPRSSTATSVRPNPLSISSTTSSTTESSTSASTISSNSTAAPAVTTTSGTTTSSTAPTATLPTLTEILNGRTVQAFNKIINISDLNKVETLKVDPKSKQVTTTLPPVNLSNRILDDSIPSTTSSVPVTTQATATTATTLRTTTTKTPSTVPPTTTAATTTTTLPPTTTATITTQGATASPLTQPATTTFRTTTGFPSTTFLPTFLTTLFSTIRPRRVSTEAPFTIVTPISNRILPNTTPRVAISTVSGDLATASTTRTVTTVAPPTTTSATRRRTTTAPAPTTTMVVTTTAPVRNAKRNTATPTTTTTNATKRLRELTDQQKKDLEMLAKLEMEQAALLRQLAFLTNFNKAETPKTTTEKNDLANRIIALAVERDRNRQTTTVSAENQTTKEGRQSKKLEYSNEQTIEELVEKLNIVTPSTVKSEYGNSNDAIVAALLKEQGIGPTTPKVVEDIYSQTTTTRKPKPKTTTERPRGPLMQSLNWLLNVLAPPTTKKPKSKPKPKPKPKPKANDEELLTHQPTHITPVVTQAPRQNIASALSQADIEKLITQLEVIQRDPKNTEGLDLSSIKSLQALLNTNEGVQVSSAGTTGTTTRETTRATTARSKTRGRVAKSSTLAPPSVSNSIVDEGFSSTTAKSKVSLPPVQLRPVAGVEESDTVVRGQLITAAVNVTRAISSFLGTALQGAATSFQSLLGSGSRAVGSLMQVSSNTSSRPG